MNPQRPRRRSLRLATLVGACLVLAASASAAKDFWPIHTLRPDPSELLDPGGDRFGTSVYIDDGRVAVGRLPSQLPVPSGGETGASYLFDTETGEQLHRVATGMSVRGEGGDVGISGEHFVVRSINGSRLKGHLDNRAWVVNATSGQIEVELSPPRIGTGRSQTIEGTTILAGGLVRFIDSFEEVWEAYLFDANSGDLVHDLTPSDLAFRQNFGWSMALDGDYALVGSPVLYSTSGNLLGSAFLFDRDSGVELFEFRNPEAAEFALSPHRDGFGLQVALGDGVAVVSRQVPYDRYETPRVGSRRLDVFSTETGELLKTLKTSDYDLLVDFSIVAVNGTTAVVSIQSDKHPDNANQFDSAVAIDLVTGKLLGEFRWATPDFAFNDSVYPRFAIDGTEVAIGVLNPSDLFANEPTGPGHVYVYDLTALAGDYDGDGQVTAADHTLWTQQLGAEGDLAADGNGDGRVDAADYTVWRDAFDAASTVQTVPEPGALALALLAGPGLGRRR